ncbi:MFS general substrate transporter [Karstenula rhodostoma CBS 690.94]|uniref:MFS general substrate transporter n=1 Tax=Karstenula rhodostoma CBS 690.94 TaxID=1392251 RepID=A0A9P4PQE1_9PLEO|nr:MFS general substrate transporter [Karstenula rhodostoma CBS 690.94]
MSLFLTNLEIPIVTTSLVSITGDLGGFDNVGWVISSYLLGYVATFGRKLMFSTSIVIFICFSAGYGAAQTLTQLIALRAFQGVGGGGCFALSTAIVVELVPPENVPAAVPALALAIFAIPKNFPNRGRADCPRTTWKEKFDKGSRAKVDVLGAALLLLATLSMTAGFEEADSRFPWKLAYVISLLTISGLLWMDLVIWERHITIYRATIEPVLPWRFFQNRAMLSLLLNAVFLGGPWFVSVFQLPQKFQLVHGSSGVKAGLQTMPFTFAAPLGSAFSALVAGKLKVPVIYPVLFAGTLQTVGLALLASLPESSRIVPRAYGFQIIAGFGCGINILTLLLIVPFVVGSRDKAIGMGAVSQLRVMSGAIGLSIVTSVFNSYTKPRISELLQASHATIDSVQSVQSISNMDPLDQERLKTTLARGYNLKMYVLCAFAALQIPAALLMWRKKQLMV